MSAVRLHAASRATSGEGGGGPAFYERPEPSDFLGSLAARPIAKTASDAGDGGVFARASRRSWPRGLMPTHLFSLRFGLGATPRWRFHCPGAALAR